MKRALIPAVFCFVACLLFAPAVGFADSGNQAKIGTTEYATLDDAFKYAHDGDTIELLCDIDTTSHSANHDTESVYYVNKNVTLDFAGYTISDTNTTDYSGLFYIDKTGELTLVNAQVTTPASAVASEDGRSLVRYCLGNLTIESTAGSGITCTYVAKNIIDFSQVTINGGTYNVFQFCQSTSDSTSLYVNGGTITSTRYMFSGVNGAAVFDMGEGSATSDLGIFIIEGGSSTSKVTVKSGTFKAGGTVMSVQSNLAHQVTIEGGEFTTTTEGTDQATICNRGKLTINGGTFTSNGKAATVEASCGSSTSSLTINGGTITNNGQGDAVLVESNRRLEASALAYINGGAMSSKGDGISIQAGGYAEIGKTGAVTVNAGNRGIAVVGTGSTAHIYDGEFETSASGGSENSSGLYLNQGDVSLYGGTFTNGAGERGIIYKTDGIRIVDGYHAIPADWDAADASRAKIIPNNITVHFNSEDQLYETVQGKYDEITFPSNPVHSQGRAFLYWADADGNVVDDLSVLDNEETTLYAVFETYTFAVTFEMNGHGAQISGQTITEGNAVTKPADPADEGWTFGGWFTDEALTEQFDFATVISEDTTLYAKWTKNSDPDNDDPDNDDPDNDDPVDPDNGDNGNPQTGDETNIAFFLVLMMLSGVACMGAMVAMRKRQ